MWKMTRKNNLNRALSVLLVMTMIFGLFTGVNGGIVIYADDLGRDVGPAGLLQLIKSNDDGTTDLFRVWQNGQEITGSDVIDPEQTIEVSFNIKFPVVGDFQPEDPGESYYVKGGDYAEFAFGGNITTSGALELVLEEQGVKTGTVTATGSAIRIDFSKDLDDPTVTGVTMEFTADLIFDLEAVDYESGDYTITILDKDYTVTVPGDILDVSGLKSGVVIGNDVLWTVAVTAQYEGEDAPLNGYELYDDLTSVGTFVEGSLKVGDSDVYEDAAEVVGDIVDNKLTYAFSETDEGTKYVMFKTAISDAKLFSSGTQYIDNNAKITKDDITNDITIPRGQASFTPQWITKTGEASGEGSEGTYTPGERKITWQITVNYNENPLYDPKITDPMPEGLEWESAVLYFLDADQEIGDEGVVSKAIEPISGDGIDIDDGIYDVSNVDNTLNKKATLVIVAKVEDDSAPVKIDTYTNDANFTFALSDGGDVKGLPDGDDAGIIGSASVNIGFNPIKKTAGSYDKVTHQMSWNVKVDTQDLDYGGNLRVLDLLVYGTSFDATQDLTITDNTSINLLQISETDIANMTPQYNQKILPDAITTGAGLVYKVHTLKNSDGDAIADVLVVTGDPDTGLVATASHNFSFDTLVMNPNYYAGNTSKTLKNTVSLFSSSTKKATDSATKSIKGNMLNKDMIALGNVAYFEANYSNLSDLNNGTDSVTGAYNYDDQYIYFRIHVNADGILNVTEDVTGIEGQSLGDLTFTDTLPSGWVFEPIDGLDYLLYEANSATLVTDDSGFLTQTKAVDGSEMSFTFSEVTQPYMIVVKAGPTTETLEGYFDSNKDTEINNTVTMTNDHMSDVTSIADITIESQVVDKTVDSSAADNDAYLTWEVVYNPYELGHDDPSAYIKDTLPTGIDLRTSAAGDLIYEGNITLYEMSLEDDGSLSQASSVDLEGTTILTYDRDTRILTFNMPDTSKAYSLTYITDITGRRGVSLTNSVELYEFDGSNTSAGDSYTISEAAYNTSFTRSGYVKINKEASSGNKIEGVEFTLYALDGTTVIRQSETNSEGIAYLTFIPVGDYILKETETVGSYVLLDESFDVNIVLEGSDFITSVDNVTGSNELTITNFVENTVGDLIVQKSVDGDDADLDKTFVFTIDLEGATGTYTYYGEGGASNGSLENGGQISLKNGQQIHIVGLPDGATYTVTEMDYTSDGYVKSSTNAAGTIIVDDVVTAGFTNTFTKVKIGDYVWLDVDQDGQQDTDDGEKPVANVVVKLFKKTDVGLIDTTSEALATTTTNDVGYYEFDDLFAGDYYIVFEVPEGYTVTTSNFDGDTSNGIDSDGISYTLADDGVTLIPSTIDTRAVIDDITVTYGNDDMTFDLGIYKSYSIGDIVWIDTDGDGIQDNLGGTEAGSEAIYTEGVIFTLYNADTDELLATDTSDANGYYEFTDLPEGNYYVTATKPAGYEVTGDNAENNGKDALDSDFAEINETTLKSGNYTLNDALTDDNGHNPTVDLGIYELAGIGDYVWIDRDYDGYQDKDGDNPEVGVPGVEVFLKDGEGKVVTKDVYGNSFVGKVTDSDGGYFFENLAPGTYYVEFIVPDDYYVTKANQGTTAEDSDDSDGIAYYDSTLEKTIAKTQEVTLIANQRYPDLDLGLYQKASLGDYVWYDNNKDGLQDDTDTPVVGMTVTLLDSLGEVLMTTVTDSEGYYLFGDLDPGTYSVKFEPVSGYVFTYSDAINAETQLNDDTKDSDVDSDGLVSGIVLESGEHNPTIDAGIRKRSSGGGGSTVTTTVPTTTTTVTSVTTTSVVPTTTTVPVTTVPGNPIYVKETTTVPVTTTATTVEGAVPQTTTAPPAPTYPKEIIFKPNEDVEKVVVKEQPKNGTVEIIDGDIVYSPGPNFDGKDQITIIVTTPDGEEEEIILDIFEELPEAGLPRTGGIPTDIIIGFGTLLIGVGLGFKKKYSK